MQNSPRAKKAAKTRAKNARFRAAKAKARSAAALSEMVLGFVGFMVPVSHR
jgi:hypothetical protein